MARLGPRLVAAALALAASGTGRAADGPPLGFLQGAHSDYRGGGPADGGQEDGFSAALRLPLGERWFVTGSTLQVDAYTNSFDQERPAQRNYAVGVGVREAGLAGEQFARLRYLEVRDWRSYGLQQERARGGTLTYGGRALLQPWFEVGLEGGAGWLGARDEHRLFFTGELALALRLVPHAWAYASYAVEDVAVVNLGLRLAFGEDRGAAAPAGRKRYGAGQAIVVAAALQLQARPAFGAPETVLIPAGSEVALLEQARNEFGNWWRVRAGDVEGWIREGHLR
jgi:hypothetical protein